MKKSLIITAFTISSILPLPTSVECGFAQTIMHDVPYGQTHWTDGFWGDRFQVFSQTSVQSMWNTWNTPEISHGFRNFEIAAGDCEGEHWGPPFHDGDMYKWLESVAAIYAVNKDPELDKLMDHFIDRVVRAQREDGYIHTPVIIREKNNGIDTHSLKRAQTVIGTEVGKENEKGAFANRLNFETYNLGHLMMAGIVHKRATGKTTLFNCAIKATDFLVHFYETAEAELARCAICPSHYMGVVEMWRETHNPRYLELAQQLIAIRSQVKNGTDDNQDRDPFETQYVAMGHAVRSTYLYAGVADVMNEIGNINKDGHDWMGNLTSIWEDIVSRKMYITGGCGALYDGTSPDGTNYKPDSIQKVHQSFGRPYQLPNSTAHNETCANIGNMLFNWRMMKITGESKYVDVAETCMLNSVLSGISMDGKKYFYTNPLRLSKDLPYTLRWPKERTEYISCFCCPPNTLRTVCEAQNYSYSVGEKSIYCQFYGSNEVTTNIPGVGDVTLRQESDYPWDGHIKLTVVNVPKKAKKTAWTIAFRLPNWSGLTGEKGYQSTTQIWKAGDTISIDLPMKAKLMEANPLAEEIRNQVAIQRGPVVYCLEECDLPKGIRLDDVRIPSDIQLQPVKMQIDGHEVMALEGNVKVADNEASWSGILYREVNQQERFIRVRFVPYFAWGNRGRCDMSVWLPLDRKMNTAQNTIVNVIGDSYVANHRQPKEYTWHYKLAQELGYQYNNYGRNGSCIAFDRTHDGRFNFGPAMWQRYKAMDPNADYVLIIAGHNDADKVGNNKDSLQMVKDSLEVMLDGIRALCPKAKIGFVTPWNVDRPGFEAICRLIKEVCDAQGIPVLWNADKDCVIQVRDDAFRKQYFQSAKDNAHLNAAGHDLFLPVAREWFKAKMLGK